MRNLLSIIALSLVSLTVHAGITTVPEPSTFALFGAAALAVIVAKKFKK